MSRRVVPRTPLSQPRALLTEAANHFSIMVAGLKTNATNSQVAAASRAAAAIAEAGMHDRTNVRHDSLRAAPRVVVNNGGSERKRQIIPQPRPRAKILKTTSPRKGSHDTIFFRTRRLSVWGGTRTSCRLSLLRLSRHRVVGFMAVF